MVQYVYPYEIRGVKTMMNKKNILRIISLLSAAVLMLVSLCSCGARRTVNAVKVSQLNETQAVYSQKSNHVSGQGNLVYVAKSGLLELFFDSVSYSVAVRDTGNGRVWYSLPEASVQDPECNAAVVSLTVSNGDRVYYLNSQDNSVAFSSASFKPLTNGVQITYDMALDAETAAKNYESLSKDDVYVSLTAVFTLSDGAFYADINCSATHVTTGWTVEKIEFMNYFGANESAGESDFLFVPDAGGALIMTGKPDDGFTGDRYYDVYGANPACKTNSENAHALFPCFGMKSGDSAFAAIILSGDALACVKASRHTGSGEYNAVGAVFEVCDSRYAPESSQKKYTGLSFSGNINICYRFLTGKNAGYVGIASACREVLIRSGVLSTELLPESEHIPFILSVQAAASKKSPHSYIKLSTYEQTLELLELMKAKSINSISLRYCGALTGADTQDALGSAKLIRSLGSARELEELTSYVSTQKFDMFLDIDILSMNRKGGENKAKSLSSSDITLENNGNYAQLTAGKKSKITAVSVTGLSDSVLSFIDDFSGSGFGGYCINDAGRLLYSDYSGDMFTRMSAASAVKSQLSVLSNNRKIMIDSGNFYTLFNADAVSDIPRNTYYAESSAYVQIPFVQMVLHGIVSYSMEPINLTDDPAFAFLKSLEYGAPVSYEWICTKAGDDEFNAKYYYQDQLADAAEKYRIADEILGDLANARMTSHYEVQSGVFCTEYNNSTVIYFNYNSQPVTVNSITVQPMSCIRAN